MIWRKDANGSSYGSSAREEPGTVPDCREQTDSEIQSEIRGITKNAANPMWILKHQHGTYGYNFLDICHVYLDSG